MSCLTIFGVEMQAVEVDAQRHQHTQANLNSTAIAFNQQSWSQYLLLCKLAASFINFLHYWTPHLNFMEQGKIARGRHTDSPI